MDVIAIERDFTAWVAEKLNLELDKGIYRGPIPSGLECGVGVLFGSEVPAAGFYGFRPRTWNVQILGKFDETTRFRIAHRIASRSLDGQMHLVSLFHQTGDDFIDGYFADSEFGTQDGFGREFAAWRIDILIQAFFQSLIN